MTLPHLDFAGLMCIPPLHEIPTKYRPFFETLRRHKEKLEAHIEDPVPTLPWGCPTILRPHSGRFDGSSHRHGDFWYPAKNP